MSFVGCTFNYTACTSGAADYMIRYGGDEISPVCTGCLKQALEVIGNRLVKVTPAN